MVLNNMWTEQSYFGLIVFQSADFVFNIDVV